MPSEFEEAFKEEIWGCYKYVGIPLETIYNMPIQERKYFIQKHNLDVKRENEALEANNGSGEMTREFSGEALNAIAAQQMKKK